MCGLDQMRPLGKQNGGKGLRLPEFIRLLTGLGFALKMDC